MSLFTPENIGRETTIVRLERAPLPGRLARAERVARNRRRLEAGHVVRPHRRRIHVRVNDKQLTELEAGRCIFRKPAEW